LETGDAALKELAERIGRVDHFEVADVAVFFGEPDKEVPDPYYGGEGPARSGCRFCGGCMTGCRYNAKNTLDKNYLYFARKKGAQLQAESEVYDVQPLSDDGSAGYRVKWRRSTSYFGRKGSFTTRGVVFAGGVLGTVKLLLKLKQNSLPALSEKAGAFVRTNSESLIGVTCFDKTKSFSDGVAIGTILHTDQHSHLEPVRYASGSGFWRLLLAPMVSGGNVLIRVGNMLLTGLNTLFKILKYCLCGISPAALRFYFLCKLSIPRSVSAAVFSEWAALLNRVKIPPPLFRKLKNWPENTPKS